MPIYQYKCAACGHLEEALQKISDDPLTDCPSCGKPKLEKQLTAAGFQLKGSGWYVTDFRNTGAKAGEKSDDKKSDPAGESKSDSGASETKTPASADGGSSATSSTGKSESSTAPSSSPSSITSSSGA
jgi:putative FmdB family regulatory protein